jgi:hypothetical protein
LVGVLDAQDELSVLLSGEEPVEDDSTDIPNVGIAGGAGGKTNAN